MQIVPGFETTPLIEENTKTYGEMKAYFYEAFFKETRIQEVIVTRPIQLEENKAKEFYDELVEKRGTVCFMDGNYLYSGVIFYRLSSYQDSFLLQQVELLKGQEDFFLLLAPYLSFIKTSTDMAACKKVEGIFCKKKIYKPAMFLEAEDFKFSFLDQTQASSILSYLHNEKIEDHLIQEVFTQAEAFLEKIRSSNPQEAQVVQYLDMMLGYCYSHGEQVE